MALPTLPSRWGHNDIEKQMQRMHEQQNNFRNHWDKTVKYFHDNSFKANIQQNWASDAVMRKSMDAYSSREEKNKKEQALCKRREKLSKLLQDERDVFEAELKGLSIGNYSRLKEMKDRTEELQSAREEKKQRIAQQKLYEHWQLNNPDLRALESQMHREHVTEAWGHQKEEKSKNLKLEKEEETVFANEYEKARVEAMERLEEKEKERRIAERDRAVILKRQIEELKERAREAETLKNEEAKIQRDQIELENIELERKKLEKRSQAQELHRFLHRQYKAQMRRRAQQIQEELELDRQILERLLQEEMLQKEIESARQEKARQDVEWMKQVLEEQIKLEKEREAELDLLYREEARQVWEKREEEWRKEREARQQLMRDVLNERSSQLAEKMEENQERQKQLLQEREELILHLEEVQKTSREEKRQKEEHKKRVKDDLVQQVTARQEKSRTARQQIEEELRAERAAEREYERVVREEATRRRETGFQPRQHVRRKVAWE